MFKPDYVFEGEPPLGEVWPVTDGVYWLRMPLPFKLDHINLWMLRDGDGWTLVDTGINSDDTRAAWEQIFGAALDGLPVTRLIVTHFHPDHVGLAGWLVDRFDVPLWMPYAEWTTGRMLSLDDSSQTRDVFQTFYRRAGFEGERLAAVDKRVGGYGSRITPIPGALRRIVDGEVVSIGGRGWRVIVGTGHSPEHACLYCEDLGVLISGDQILPKISPNVSVWPTEPEADPLARFLGSLDTFRGLPADTLVLPSHNWPFRGLLARLDDLATHHAERLEETQAACVDGATGVEVLEKLFTRPLDIHQLFFAIGETLAHLHRLMATGQVVRVLDTHGVYRFTSAG